MSSSHQTTASASSSQHARDIAFFSGLTFVLEPKHASVTPSPKTLQTIASQLGVSMTPTKDPRSKNYWVQASERTQATKIRILLKKRNSDFGDFTVREIHPNSAEEARIRRHITEQLALTTTPGPDPNESGSSTRDDGEKQEVDSSRHEGRRQSRRRTARCQATPSQTSPLDEEAAPLPSRKRKAARAFTDIDEAPAAVVNGSGPPGVPVVERPRKQVKFDLSRNTYKYFEKWDEPGSISSSSNTPGEAQFASAIKKLPPACLQRILVYSVPDPTSNSARKYRSALYGMMLVCSKWKNALESAPSIWSYISNANPPRMVDAWIQRSSGVTITVKFDGSTENPSRVEFALGRFVDKVTPHRLRWRSVTFSNVPPTLLSYLAVARAFNGPAPALASAKVTTINETTMPFIYSLRFFEGNAQALRYITLTGVTPDLSDVPVFANLESLRIIQPTGICPVSVLRMLARNSRLRSLELVEVRPSYSRLSQHIETLELPELVDFKLHLLKEDTVEMAQLFTRLRAPKCRRLDLAIDMEHLKNLRLEFNTLDFGIEAFLVELGAWMANWIVLNRAVSVDTWVDNIPGVDSSKSAFRWQYGGVVNGSRGLSADVRLEVGSQQMKQFILRWIEDVKLCAELLEERRRFGTPRVIRLLQSTLTHEGQRK